MLKIMVALAMLVAVPATTLAAGAAATPKTHSGVYSNVQMSEETGDEGGYKVVVHAEGATPTVDFTECGGECGDPIKVPAKLVNDTIEFSIAESGPSAPPTRYVGQFVGKNLVLHCDQCDTSVLKPVTEK